MDVLKKVYANCTAAVLRAKDFVMDTATAGSIMFLLGIGELLEEWTHKKFLCWQP